jgi:hypothetical protein
MTTFTFVPFVGPSPLRFGMTPEEVAALVGDPERLFPDPFGNRSESRAGYSLGYDAKSGELTEAVFSKGELLFHGVNLFAIANVIDFLRKYDESPQMAVGMIFFVKLGLRLSVFHDDESQKAIGVTARGHWDEFLLDFVPFE